MIMSLFILLFYLQTFKDQNEKKNNYTFLGESQILNQKLDFIHENVINIQILDFSNLIYRTNMMVGQFLWTIWQKPVGHIHESDQHFQFTKFVSV